MNYISVWTYCQVVSKMKTHELIGVRLREERNRLGLSQTAFAALADSVYKTQLLYEKGGRVPDASYLAAVADAGVDVLYVITGRREKAT